MTVELSPCWAHQPHFPASPPLLFSWCHKDLLNQENHTENMNICRGVQASRAWSLKDFPCSGSTQEDVRLSSHPAQKGAASHSGIPPPYTRAGNKANSQSYLKNDSNDVN